jgi:hypothetical protein
MAGIGTIGTTVIGTTVIGATGKLGQIRTTALNEQVRAASFAKALLIRQKAAAGLIKSVAASHSATTPHRQIKPNDYQTLATDVRYRGRTGLVECSAESTRLTHLRRRASPRGNLNPGG